MVAPVQISLPDALWSVAERRAREAGFESVESFLRCLVRAELERPAPRDVSQMVIEGLESPRGQALDENWEQHIRDLAAQRRGAAR